MSDAKPNDNRRIACEFLIAAAVCGSAYYFLADSAGARLAKVRAEVAEALVKESARAGVGNLTDAQVQDLRHTTAARVADIRARSEPASDEAVMFARVSELALAHSLRVDVLSPARSSVSGGAAPNLPPGVHAGTPAAAPPPGSDPAGPAPRDSSVIYSITLIGPYSGISAFLAELPEHAGYSTLRSLRLSQPDIARPDQLHAALETEHFAFDVSAFKLPAPRPASPVRPTTTTQAPD
ncbi:MAG TPA: hypothetical protein PKE29_17965 [Phycisphaerales bacterium]|nr:hypothetical protein [Phycisphaerales bacterium]